MLRSDWKVIAHFFVAGEAAGQPRGKISSHGRFPRIYTDYQGKPGTWKETLYWVAKHHVPAQPFGGPVKVWVKAYFPRTQQFLKPCYPDGPFEMIQKPDDDNIRKMVLDVFTSLQFYRDDKQVCGGDTQKLYVGKPGHIGRGSRVGAEILIEVNPNWPYKKTNPVKTPKGKRK